MTESSHPISILKGKSIIEDIKFVMDYMRQEGSKGIVYPEDKIEQIIGALRHKHTCLSRHEVSIPITDVEALIERIGFTEESLRESREKLAIFQGMLKLAQSSHVYCGVDMQEDTMISSINRKIEAKRKGNE